MKRRPRLDLFAASILLVCCAVWGLNSVAIKIAGEGMSPMFAAGLRSVVAAALLAGWCALRRIPLRPPAGTVGFSVLMGILFAAEFALMYVGLTYTTASRSVIFIFTAPFFVALGAHYFLPGERLTPARGAGLALAFGGLCLAFADGLYLPDPRALLGDALELAAAALWGGTTVMIKRRYDLDMTAHRTLFYQLAVSGPLLLGAALLVAEPGLFAPRAAVLAAFAYQAVAIAFVSYLVWYWLLAYYPAAPLAAFSFWTPLFGVAAGALLLGEPLGPRLVAAALMVAGGIVLVNRPDRVSSPLATPGTTG